MKTTSLIHSVMNHSLMKKSILLVLIGVAPLLFYVQCEESEELIDDDLYFLSEIRPDFFENLNFLSDAVIANIPTFRENLAKTYERLEEQYNKGEFETETDLEYMRLIGMYYSFYLLALGGNYNDHNLTFENIMGSPGVGYYSKLPSSTPNFEQKELEAMMEEASRVARLATDINGFNDKTYGFYLSVRQVEERLKNKGVANNPETQDLVIDYVNTRMVNFDRLPDWNVLMALVTFTNYADSLNTFKNPRMNNVLFHVNARLVPGLLPDLGGIYPEIMGPIYRFDLNLKKLDWLLQVNETFTPEQLEELDSYIETLETASEFIEAERTDILNSWDDRYTFEQRKEKLQEIKEFREQLSSRQVPDNKPDLAPFIDSKEFKKAYQCYSCHKASGL